MRYWSDYSRVFYHPNSIMQLYDSDLSPERKAFEGWHDGEELFQALDREKDVFDEQLRPFAEECDQMQGFQIVTSVDDGWGGFAGKCMERVRDEFGKSPVWLWGLNAPKAGSRVRASVWLVLGRGMELTIPQIEQDRRAANEARSLTELAGQASLYLPLRYVPTRLPSYIALDHSSRWSVSALQQMAFESLLLPTRLKPLGVHDTSNMEELLLACNSDDNKRIAEVKLDIGGMSEMNGSHDAEPHTTGIGKGCDFFPYASGRSRSEDEPHVFSELSTSRGAYVDEQADTSMEETRISRYETQRDPSLPCSDDFRRFHTDLAFPIIDSFPPIFPNKPRSVNKLPAKASVSKSSRIAGWSKSLEASVRRRVGVDEREPILDGLRSTSDAYAAGGEDRAAGDEDWDD